MTTQPEDLRSEPATPTEGGEHPHVPDPDPGRRGPPAQEPATPSDRPPADRSRAGRVPPPAATAGAADCGVATARVGWGAVAAGDGDAGGATEGRGRGTAGRRWFRYTLPGAVGAVLFACLSFTPSLLPRGGLHPGPRLRDHRGHRLRPRRARRLGVARVRRPGRPRRPDRRRGATFLISRRSCCSSSRSGSGQYWQREIRGLMGVTDVQRRRSSSRPPDRRVVFFALFLLVGRGLRRRLPLGGEAAEPLDRPARGRARSGWVAGRRPHLPRRHRRAARRAGQRRRRGVLGARHHRRPEGVHQPTHRPAVRRPRLRWSPWDSLGRQGRKFTGLGPTASDIERVVAPPGHGADPGVRRAWRRPTTPRSGPHLAVDDLERAGGFQRANLLVVTTTGSGWVDPALVDTLRVPRAAATRRPSRSSTPTCRRGSPTWSTSPRPARPAGPCSTRSTTAWSQLPAGPAPQAATSPARASGRSAARPPSAASTTCATAPTGTLFAGPPNFNTLFREFSDNRDAGSPEIQPVYKDGRTVRFASDAGAGDPAGGPALGRHPGALPDAPVRPDRLVEPAA